MGLCLYIHSFILIFPKLILTNFQNYLSWVWTWITRSTTCCATGWAKLSCHGHRSLLFHDVNLKTKITEIVKFEKTEIVKFGAKVNKNEPWNYSLGTTWSINFYTIEDNGFEKIEILRGSGENSAKYVEKKMFWLLFQAIFLFVRYIDRVPYFH